MSNQPHDPYADPYGQAPAAWPPPYEQEQLDDELGGPAHFPPAAGQGADDYAAPPTQQSGTLHEESSAVHQVLGGAEDAAQTAYLPPVTDHGVGLYDGGHGGHGSYGGHGGAVQPSPYGEGTGGAAAETAYLPPVTEHGEAPYGTGTGSYGAGVQAPGAGHAVPHQGAPTGAHAGAHAGAAEETAYLPPVTGDDPAQQGSAQWPHGWERPSAPRRGRRAKPDGAGPGPGQGAGPDAGPAPGGPQAPDGTDGPGTVYGAPTVRRPKPPAEVLREEGRSPVIAPGPQPAGLTAVLAVMLLVTAALDVRPGLALGVALLQGVTAVGWFRLNGMWPARQGIALAAAAGLTTTLAMLATGRDDATTAALGALGAWAAVIILVELRVTTSPAERLTALTATLAAALLAVLAAGYLAAEPAGVIVGTAAVAAAVLVRAVPLPPQASPVVAAVAGALAGCVAGLATDIGAAGGLLGLAAGVAALIGIRAASYDFPSRFVHMTAGVALPLTLAVPAVHLIGRALV